MRKGASSKPRTHAHSTDSKGWMLMGRIACMTGGLVVPLLLVSQAAGEKTQPHFADNIAGGHYSKHVHLQHHDNVTYIVMNATADEDPHAWAYDHDTGQWRNGGAGTFIAKNPQDNSDDHGNPSIIVDDAGYIHAFFGGHSGFKGGDQQYYRSTEPGQIDQWQDMNFDARLGTPGGAWEKSTYPMGWTNSDGSISVMYRNGDHHMPGSDPWVIQTSTDNGETWSGKRKIIQKMPGKNGDADMYAIPVKYPGKDKVGIGISDEYMAGAPRHTTDDVFYVVYDTANDTLQNIEGTTINDGGDGLSQQQLIDHFHFADYEALGNQKKRIAVRPGITDSGVVNLLTTNGNPDGFDGEGRHGGKHRVWQWDEQNGTWDANDPSHNFHYWIEEDGEALLSFKGGGAGNIKELIRSTDGGATWDVIETIEIPHFDGDNYGVLSNDGTQTLHPDARAIFYERGDDANNHVYLWGDSGFVAVHEPASIVE